MRYKKLKDELHEHNMSIRQLAIASNITPQALYAALNGRAEFWPGYKHRVANALGKSEEELFDEAD